MSANWNDITVSAHRDGVFRAEAPNGVVAYSNTEVDARERCIYMLGMKDGADTALRYYRGLRDAAPEAHS